MAKVCAICGKKPIVGNKVQPVAHANLQSGKAKREGGVGKKTTGITKVWKQPNLQRVKVFSGGHARAARVCTSCPGRDLWQKYVQSLGPNYQRVNKRS